jgi:hypothetical protein
MTTSRSEAATRRRLFWIASIVAILVAAGIAILAQREPERRPPVVRPAGPPPATVVAAEPEQPPLSVRQLPQKRQLALAFRAAFGKPQSSVLTIRPDEASGDDFTEQVEFSPGQLIWADFGPILVSEGEVQDAAHVSTGKLAVAYMNPSGEGFSTGRKWVPAVSTGSFGKVGEWHVSNQIGEHPVLAAEGGGTWQGYSCSWTTLVALTPDGPTQLARIPMSYSDAGAVRGPKAVAIKGKLANIMKNQSFDVRYSGSRSFVDHYVRKGSGYVLSSGTSAIPQC